MTEKLIEDYLAGHTIARYLEERHMKMLDRIFLSLTYQSDTESLLCVNELMTYCDAKLTNYEYPEPAIARIASKALEIMLANRSLIMKTEKLTY